MSKQKVSFQMLTAFRSFESYGDLISFENRSCVLTTIVSRSILERQTDIMYFFMCTYVEIYLRAVTPPSEAIL